MLTDTTYGSCTLTQPGDPVASVDVQVSAVDMMVHWARCSLTANYLAGYVAPSFRDADAARVEISIILDELIENAVKFCADVEEPVVVTVDNYGEAVRLRVSNLCREHHARDLGRAIHRVLSGSPEELFVEQVEASAADDQDSSRLGFITLSMNNAVRLGARITRSARDGYYTVTVQVMIDRDDLTAGPQAGQGTQAC